MSRSIALLATAAAAAAVGLVVGVPGASPAAQAATLGAKVQLMTTAALPGAVVDFDGAAPQLPDGGTCVVTWDGVTTGDPCAVTSNGAVSGSLSVPPEAPPGTHEVAVCWPLCWDADPKQATGYWWQVPVSFAVLTVVPQVVGLGRERAAEALDALGLVLSAEGKGVGTVGSQDPAAMTPVPLGSAVRVVLLPVTAGGGAPAATRAVASPTRRTTVPLDPTDAADSGPAPVLPVLAILFLLAAALTGRVLATRRGPAWVGQHVRAVPSWGGPRPTTTSSTARPAHVVRLAPHEDAGTQQLEELSR